MAICLLVQVGIVLILPALTLTSTHHIWAGRSERNRVLKIDTSSTTCVTGITLLGYSLPIPLDQTYVNRLRP